MKEREGQCERGNGGTGQRLLNYSASPLVPLPLLLALTRTIHRLIGCCIARATLHHLDCSESFPTLFLTLFVFLLLQSLDSFLSFNPCGLSMRLSNTGLACMPECKSRSIPPSWQISRVEDVSSSPIFPRYITRGLQQRLSLFEVCRKLQCPAKLRWISLRFVE